MVNTNNLDYIKALWGAYNAIEKAQELTNNSWDDQKLQNIKNVLEDLLNDEID